MIAFDLPWVLFAAPAVALLFMVLGWWVRASRIRRAGNWSRDLAARAAASGRWSAVLLGVAAFCITVAIAGPRFGSRTVTADSKALNLVIVADISRSMLAEDVEPSRLERTQREARRLIQDLGGDRIGLIAFAGNSYILSPLTIDDGALRLLVDGLDPTLASVGGTGLGRALNQGRELLLAGTGVADRVLVVFSDGETHDSLPEVLSAARELRDAGIHMILVAEGGSEPVRIPLRDVDGALIGYQRDADNAVVYTSRRDDILGRIADAAQGAVVSGELPDQAGAVRELVDVLKRSPMATTTSAQDIPRSWIPTIVGVVLLMLQTLSRRSAALAVLAIALGRPASSAAAQGIPNPGDRAWREGDFRRAAGLYQLQYRAGDGGDTSALNVGTAALALSDSSRAREYLEAAAASIDPDVRFRALYNLGLLSLRMAEHDSTNRETHLETARYRYREALLLRPDDRSSKWNYELAQRQMAPPPEDEGGGENEAPPPPSGGQSSQPDTPVQGLTREQAEQILNSMLEEERQTREDLNRRRSRNRDVRRRKDW